MGSYLTRFIKSPASVIRVGVNFGDTLSANGFRQTDIHGLNIIAETPLTVLSSVLNGSLARAHVTGGVLGQTLLVTFQLMLKSPAGILSPDVALERSVLLVITRQ